jgi:hypothetical protein
MDTKTFNVSIAMLGLTAIQLVIAQQILVSSDPQSLSNNTVLLIILAGVQVALYIIGFIVLRVTMSHAKKAAAKHKSK